MLEDRYGNVSSKRIWANRLLIVCMVIFIIYFLVMLGFALAGISLTWVFPLEGWLGLLGGGITLQTSTIFEPSSK